MRSIDFNFKPTIIGSMPHTDPQKACQLIAHYLKDIPAWPQLPRRSTLEGMNVQFSRGFPGLETDAGKVLFRRSESFLEALQGLYEAYLGDDYAFYALTPEYGAGLHYFINMEGLRPLAAKGQITGPISWCLTIRDENGKSILYDDTLADAAARMLALSARWQEDQLSRLSRQTIVFIDEPAMSSYGSAFFNLPREKVLQLIGESMSKLTGLKGIHCCGNTDWGTVLAAGMDILSLDAYQHGSTLNLYPQELAAFINRGGGIAWGIVPNDEKGLSCESAASLKDRLESMLGDLSTQNISFRQLAKSSLVTPSCSLAGLSEEGAEYSLELLVKLSALMSKYCS